jgi:hypothetical protein
LLPEKIVTDVGSLLRLLPKTQPLPSRPAPSGIAVGEGSKVSSARSGTTSQGGGFYMDSYIVHYFTNYVQTFYNLYPYVFYINMEFSTKTIQNKCTTYGTPILYFKHIHAYSEHLYV